MSQFYSDKPSDYIVIERAMGDVSGVLQNKNNPDVLIKWKQYEDAVEIPQLKGFVKNARLEIKAEVFLFWKNTKIHKCTIAYCEELKLFVPIAHPNPTDYVPQFDMFMFKILTETLSEDHHSCFKILKQRFILNEDVPTADRWNVTGEQILYILKRVKEEAKKPGRKKYSEWTMYDVCENIVGPLSIASSKSYALQCNTRGLDADIFVSHGWGEKFVQFVKSLQSLYPDFRRRNFWICTFAICQNGNVGAQIGQDIARAPFIQAMIGMNEMAIIRNDQCDIYTRRWCVCELVFAKKFRESLTLRVGGPRPREPTPSCENSRCSKTEDEERIMAALLTHSSILEMDGIIQRLCVLPERQNGIDILNL